MFAGIVLCLLLLANFGQEGGAEPGVVMAKIDPTIRNDPAIYPPKAVLDRLEHLTPRAAAGSVPPMRNVGTTSTIAQFKHSVEAVLGKLRAASMQLEMTSADLNKAADTVSADVTERCAFCTSEV